jgi:DNA-binding beta-propeller fold protein YncE
LRGEDGKLRIFVSNYASKSISVINYEKLEVEKEVFLDENIYPHHFCINPNDKLSYIPSSFNGILYILDINKSKIVDSVSIGGNLSQIALCNNEIFISNEDSNSIYIVDKDNLLPVGVICVDNMPHGFAFDKSTNRLFVPCNKSILSIDVVNKVVDKKVEFNFKPWHIKIDELNDLIYASTLDGKIVVLDKRDLNLKKVIDKFRFPVEICLNNNKNEIYVTDLLDKNIKVIDCDTYNIKYEMGISGNPQGLEISKDKKYIFVSDTLENDIKVFETDSYNFVKSIKVGKEPTTIICM